MEALVVSLCAALLMGGIGLMKPINAEQRVTPAPNVKIVRLDPRFDKLVPANVVVKSWPTDTF